MEYIECKTMNSVRGSVSIEGKHLIILTFLGSKIHRNLYYLGGLVPNRKRSTPRLYIVTLLI